MTISGNISIGDTFYRKVSTAGLVDPKTLSINQTNNYSLYLSFRGPCSYDLVSSNGSDATEYIFESATASWIAGLYKYVLYAQKSGSPITDSYTLETGTIEFIDRIDLNTAPVDQRGHYKKVLDAIEAVIEKRATKDQESYSMAGRSLSRTPLADLLMLRNYYYDQYQKTLRKSASKINKIKVRM